MKQFKFLLLFLLTGLSNVACHSDYAEDEPFDGGSTLAWHYKDNTTPDNISIRLTELHDHAIYTMHDNGGIKHEVFVCYRFGEILIHDVNNGIINDTLLLPVVSDPSDRLYIAYTKNAEYVGDNNRVDLKELFIHHHDDIYKCNETMTSEHDIIHKWLIAEGYIYVNYADENLSPVNVIQITWRRPTIFETAASDLIPIRDALGRLGASDELAWMFYRHSW